MLIPNLFKCNSTVSQPNRVWVTDIKYVRTWEWWLYLAVVLDVFPRKVICRSNRLTTSVSRRGNCWHNAVAETFFSSLKKERITKHIYNTRQQAIHDIANYIAIERDDTSIWRASALGNLGPQQGPNGRVSTES